MTIFTPPSDGHHSSLCCCFFVISVVLRYGRRFRLRSHEQCLALVATSRVEKDGHKRMASRWRPFANHRKHLLRYGSLDLLLLIYSIISRLLVRIFEAYSGSPS